MGCSTMRPILAITGKPVPRFLQTTGKQVAKFKYLPAECKFIPSNKAQKKSNVGTTDSRLNRLNSRGYSRLHFDLIRTTSAEISKIFWLITQSMGHPNQHSYNT